MIFFVLLNVVLGVICNCNENTQECRKYCQEIGVKKDLADEGSSKHIIERHKGSNGNKVVSTTEKGGGEEFLDGFKGALPKLMESDMKDSKLTERTNMENITDQDANNSIINALRQKSSLSNTTKGNEKETSEKAAKLNENKRSAETPKKSNLVSTGNGISAGSQQRLLTPNKSEGINNVSNLSEKINNNNKQENTNLINQVLTNGSSLNSLRNIRVHPDSIAQSNVLNNKKVNLTSNNTGSANNSEIAQDQMLVSKNGMESAKVVDNKQANKLGVTNNNLVEDTNVILAQVPSTQPIHREQVPDIVIKNDPGGSLPIINAPMAPVDSTPNAIIQEIPTSLPSPSGNQENSEVLAQVLSLVKNLQNPVTVAPPQKMAPSGIDTEHRYLGSGGPGFNDENNDASICNKDISCLQIMDLKRKKNFQDDMDSKKERRSDPCLFYKMIDEYSKGINFLSPEIKKELNRLKGKFFKKYSNDLKNCSEISDHNPTSTLYSVTTRGFLDGIVDYFKESNTNSKTAEKPGLIFDEFNNANNLENSTNSLNQHEKGSGTKADLNQDITITKFVTLDKNDKIDMINRKTITKTVTIGGGPINEQDDNKNDSSTEPNISEPDDNPRDISETEEDQKGESTNKNNAGPENSQSESKSPQSKMSLSKSTILKTTTLKKTVTETKTITITQGSGGSAHPSISATESKKASKSISSSMPASSQSIDGKPSSDSNADIFEFFKKLDENSYKSDSVSTVTNDILKSIYLIIQEMNSDRINKKSEGKRPFSQNVSAPISSSTISQTVAKGSIQDTKTLTAGEKARVTITMGEPGQETITVSEQGQETATIGEKDTKTITVSEKEPETVTIVQKLSSELEPKKIIEHEKILKEIRKDQQKILRNMQDLAKENKKEPSPSAAVFGNHPVSIDPKNTKPPIDSMTQSIADLKNKFINDLGLNIEIITELPSLSSGVSAFSPVSTSGIEKKNVRDDPEKKESTINKAVKLNKNALETTSKTEEPEKTPDYFQTVVLTHKSPNEEKENIKIKIEDNSESTRDEEKIEIHDKDT